MTEDDQKASSADGGAPSEFPTEFPLKAIGKGPDFAAEVFALVQAHTGPLDESALSMRPSAGGKYTAVTVRFTAQSRAQLEAIYRDLHAHPDVLTTL